MNGERFYVLVLAGVIAGGVGLAAAREIIQTFAQIGAALAGVGQ